MSRETKIGREDDNTLRVRIIHQEDIEGSVVESAIDVIAEVSALLPIDIESDIKDPWNEENWNQEELTTFYSHDPRRRQLYDPSDRVNADALSSLIAMEFGEESLYIISNDLFCYDETTNLPTMIVGGSRKKRPVIVSTYHFSEIEEYLDCIKTVVMHELGHFFGLVPKDLKENIIDGVGGKHCKNNCVMRPGKKVPGDWIKYTLDRQRNGPFCSRCLSIMKE